MILKYLSYHIPSSIMNGIMITKIKLLYTRMIVSVSINYKCCLCYSL